MNTKFWFVRTAMLGGAMLASATMQAQPVMDCAEVAGLDMRDMKFGRPAINVEASLVAAGDTMPEHCKITGRLWPEIDFMIKLPTDWNGDFVMTGNQGMAGQIREHYMTRFVALNYASAGDNGGHDTEGMNMGWAAAGQPNADQKLEDLAFRSIHETSHLARRLISHYYGIGPEYAYFWGTSHGGRQVMRNFQMYPDDFDGWLPGMALANVTGTILFNSWNQYATGVGLGAIPPSKLPTLADAVFAKCDAMDGAEEGLIEDPTLCDFQPAHDLTVCAPGADASDCFTLAQVQALETVYGGPKTSGGKPMFVPLLPGAEALTPPPAGVDGGYGEGPWRSIWMGFVVNPQGFNGGMAASFVPSYLRINDWDPMSGNFDWYTQAIGEGFAWAADATRDTDLDDIKSSGKKILQWHGWSDALVPPNQVVNYYEALMARYGRDETENFYRLYMIPGFAHGGGTGPGHADWFEALRAWVEDGVEPGAIIGSRPALGDQLPALTRPICIYPQKAKYGGSGNINDARSYHCVERIGE